MKKLFTKLALAGAMLGLGLSTAQADPLKVGFVYQHPKPKSQVR